MFERKEGNGNLSLLFKMYNEIVKNVFPQFGFSFLGILNHSLDLFIFHIKTSRNLSKSILTIIDKVFTSVNIFSVVIML